MLLNQKVEYIFLMVSGQPIEWDMNAFCKIDNAWAFSLKLHKFGSAPVKSCKMVGVGHGGGGSFGVGGSKQLEKLPDSIIGEILQRLDLESLCSVTCVSTTLRSIVSQILSSLSSIDFSVSNFLSILNLKTRFCLRSEVLWFVFTFECGDRQFLWTQRL